MVQPAETTASDQLASQSELPVTSGDDQQRQAKQEQ